MNNELKFLQGLASAYEVLETKTDNTFYFTTDDKELYIGEKKITNAKDLADAIVRIAANETNITSIQNELKTLTGDGEEGGDSIQDMIDKAVEAAKTELSNKIGDLSTLDSEVYAEANTSTVAALNSIATKVKQVYNAEKITIEKDDKPEDAAAKYTIKQGGVPIAQTIDIPKDMVVSSGEVVVITQEQIDEGGEYHNKVDAPGTYIKLTLANAEKSELFILVDTLVDIYKAATDEGKTKEIKVTVDNEAREIYATIQAGAVSAEKLANNAITANKIAENAVSSANIQSNAITADKIVEKAISESKLDDTLKNKIDNTTVATIDDEEKTAGVWNDETGGQLFFLNKSNNVRANVSVNNGTDKTGIYVQLSATDKDSNQGSRIDLNEHKAYYTTDKTSTEHTDKDEIAVKGDLDAYTKTAELGDLATMDEADLDLTAYAKKEEIIEGTTNGAISVAGQSVNVHGLSELINAGVEQAKAYTDEKLTWGTIEAE